MKIIFYFKRLILEFKYPRYKLSRALKKIFFQKKKLNDKLDRESLIAVCDLNYIPITYNFGEYLILLSKHIHVNKIKNLKFIFIWPNKELTNFLKNNYPIENIPPVNISPKEMKWRMNNLIMPMLDLFPINLDSIEIFYDQSYKKNLNDKIVTFPQNYDFNNPCGIDINLIFKLSRNEIIKYGQKSSSKAKEHIYNFFESKKIDRKKTISITLREYNFDKSRNSNLKIWNEFSIFLEDQGLNVLFVPDTHNLWSELKGKKINIFPEFAINLDLRYALYENIVFNFFTSGGPGSHCGFSSNKINFAIYKMQIKKDSIINTKEGFAGTPYSNQTQPQYFDKDQYVVYEDESLDNLINFYHEHVKEFIN